MTQHKATPNYENRRLPSVLANSYYAVLGLHPSASPIEIRRSYRELSKRYHPDTTELPTEVATAKFHQLNEAYATLSNLERRMLYDKKIVYSRLTVIQPPPHFNRPASQSRSAYSSSAYLDPTDRPLSAGEIFVLFILGLTFLVCLLLAIVIGLTRPNAALQVNVPQSKLDLQPTLTVKEQIKSLPVDYSSSIQFRQEKTN